MLKILVKDITDYADPNVKYKAYAVCETGWKGLWNRLVKRYVLNRHPELR